MSTTTHGNFCAKITRFGVMNSYLVEEDDGLTAIDTGMGGSANGILTAAQAIGKPIRRADCQSALQRRISMIKRRGLTQEAVVRRAVEMANGARNPDAVTLTGLAASLDIQPPSLYNHIAGLDGLRREMRLYALTRLSRALRQAAAGETGRKALVYLAHAYRQFAQENPGIYPLILAAVPTEDAAATAASEEILTTIVLILGSLGLAGEDAWHAVRGLRSLLHGFVSLEMSGGFEMPLEVETSFQRAVTAYIDGMIGK